MVLGAVAEAEGQPSPIWEVGAKSPGTSRYPHPAGRQLVVHQCYANVVCGVGLSGAAAGMQDPAGGRLGGDRPHCSQVVLCPLGWLADAGAPRWVPGVGGCAAALLLTSLCLPFYQGFRRVAAPAAEQKGPGPCVTVQMCMRTCLVITIQM